MQEELADGEELAHCPSCTLVIEVIYNPDDFQPPKLPDAPGEAPVGVPAANA